MMSKREKRRLRIDELFPLFRCPHCRQELYVSDNDLRCRTGHTFPIAKQGHVHLLNGKGADDYSKELFQARKDVLQEGIYDPLYENLTPLLPEGGTVLDAGCGEGSHLTALGKKKTFDGIGIDNAKAAVQMAAAQSDDMVFAAGDLADAPMVSGRLDGILNVLSPANYTEFKRMLKPEGRVIKVIPNTSYLTELRTAAGKAPYSNEEVRRGFFDAFPHAEEIHTSWNAPLTPASAALLWKMTPLTWNTAMPETFQPETVTIDITILHAFTN
ncbi:putative RNA methyltransferase [Alkalicoccus urumqiensis]|uniref:SAM-dependent methyltransferase n=1 Tax=Alkalicoccus urumqiensis TaxID=1548213 RepID=A0A2P6MIA2_ALKUR|nr:methyltransferase domain-containing protein [Alkalicoccus urumqiensis]PRO66012.1 SAM-dependent methyltransferase [Alkalicoccus urumqiensis]